MTNLNALLTDSPPLTDALANLYLPGIGIGLGLGLVVWMTAYTCVKAWRAFQTAADD